MNQSCGVDQALAMASEEQLQYCNNEFRRLKWHSWGRSWLFSKRLISTLHIQSQTHSVSPDKPKTIHWLSLSSHDRQEWTEFMRELSLTYGAMSQELSGARFALIKPSREILSRETLSDSIPRWTKDLFLDLLLLGSTASLTEPHPQLSNNPITQILLEIPPVTSS